MVMVLFADYVQPICLPFGEMARRDLTNTRVWVSGWGTTETGSYKMTYFQTLEAALVTKSSSP